MKIIEQISIVLTVLGVLMMIFLIPGGETILGISLTFLAITYSLGFFFFNAIPFSRAFEKKAYDRVTITRGVAAFGAGLIFSILVVGVLFKLLQLPGAQEMMQMGLVGGLLLLVVSIIRYLRSNQMSQFLQVILIRTVLWGVISAITFWIPGTVLVEAFYRDNPAYVEAYKAASEDPENVELQIKAEELR